MKYEKLLCGFKMCPVPGVSCRREGESLILDFVVDRDCDRLCLRLWTEKKGRKCEISFDEPDRRGNVWRLCIRADADSLPSELYYNYVADGLEFTDRYALYTDAPEKWEGAKGADRKNRLLRGVIKPFEDIEPLSQLGPKTAYRDMVVYRLHVRGFTEHGSSEVEQGKRGKFSGIEEKIDYLKELGINTLELMPFYEFNESFKKGRLQEEKSQVEPEKAIMAGHYIPGPVTAEDKRTDYWGFTDDALRFSVKNVFGGAEGLRSLVKKLHSNGMELIADMYFSGEEPVTEVLSVLRYYVARFGIDGFHLIGFAPVDHIAEDAYLKDTKIWTDNIPESAKDHKLIARYDDGFCFDIRRFLKGDENMTSRFAERNRDGGDRPVINYVANVNGLNLRDMVSYDRKHNEENGENNLDGGDCNFSWNCGVEGETGRKKIKELRTRQMKNALLMLLLSQGTPLILSGDEMGHTKKGNNNSYCQDNSLEWLNWNDIKKNAELFGFVKDMIAFRKAHRIFSTGRSITNTDYRRTGIPDVSYHGESAWRADMEPFRRTIGILYNGAYGESAEGDSEDLIYVAINMHWEDHSFSLPTPELNSGTGGKKANSGAKKAKKWYKIIDTSLKDSFIPDELCDMREAVVKERSISVYKAKQGA